jgi:hypothetical protein
MEIIKFISDNGVAFVAAFIALLLALKVVGLLLQGLFKVVRWQWGVDVLAALDLDLAKLIAVLQGWKPENKPGFEKGAKPTRKPPSVPPAGMAALFIGLLLSGCTMSLEQARADGIAKRVASKGAFKVATRTECESLDSIQRYAGYAGFATGPVSAAAAGVAAVPGLGSGAQDGLIITAGVAAALTVFEFAEQKNFSDQWVAQGCGQ